MDAMFAMDVIDIEEQCTVSIRDTNVETAVHEFSGYSAGVDVKIIGMAKPYGASETYSFQRDENGNLELAPRVIETLRLATKYIGTPKIDGQNSIISRVATGEFRLHLRLDWRQKVAFFSPDGKFYPCFPQKFSAKLGKTSPRFELCRPSVTIESFFAQDSSVVGWKLLLIGDYSGHNHFPSVIPNDSVFHDGSDAMMIKCLELTPISPIILGDSDDGFPAVVYRPEMGITCVDCPWGPFVGRQNISLDEIMAIVAPGETKASFEDISSNVQGGKYMHLSEMRKNVKIIYPHGASFVQIPLPQLPLPSDSDAVFSAFVEDLYKASISYSFQPDRPREGIVFYFLLVSGAMAMFKINQGHMVTYAKLANMPLPMEHKNLFFD
jgi:hypothetical protein